MSSSCTSSRWRSEAARGSSTVLAPRAAGARLGGCRHAGRSGGGRVADRVHQRSRRRVGAVVDPVRGERPRPYRRDKSRPRRRSITDRMGVLPKATGRAPISAPSRTSRDTVAHRPPRPDGSSQCEKVPRCRSSRTQVSRHLGRLTGRRLRARGAAARGVFSADEASRSRRTGATSRDNAQRAGPLRASSSVAWINRAYRPTFAGSGAPSHPCVT